MSELLSKSDLLKLQQKWLSLFEWTPVHWLINSEIKDENLRPKWKFQWYYYTHEDAFEENWNTPVSHCYTPNGNFAKANEWKKTGDKSNRKEVDSEEEIYTFMIDLDKKSIGHPNAPDYSRGDLLAMMQREHLPIQYVTETPGWWHMYMFVHPEDRRSLTRKIFSELQTSFAIRFDADELKDISRVMRVPFSKYWKWWDDQWHVRLYRTEILTDGSYELEEVTRPDQIEIREMECLQAEYINQMYTVATEKITITNTATEDKFFDKASGWAASFIQKCNAIKLEKIMNALKKYPRYNKILGQYEYPVVINGTRIALQRITNEWEMWEFYETGWYRINKDENYVNNLSTTHDREERPAGWPYAFILNWFNGSHIKMYSFFEDEFGFERRVDQKDLYMTLQASRWVIDFSTTWVTYTVTTIREGKTNTKQIRLMHIWCFPKAIVKTKWNTGKSESENENKYILLTTKRWEDILIAYHTDKKAFNRVHWCHGMQFIWDEVCMNDWYEAIWEAGESTTIPTYQYYWTNGFYPEGFLYGKTWIMPDWSVRDTSEIWGKYFWNPLLEMAHKNKTPITVADFYDSLEKMFPKRIALVSLLWYLAGMLGMNFWDPILGKLNSTKIVPPTFLSGITKSGKSTLTFLMKEWLGINPSDRTVAINSVTTQPLQQLCTDNVTLHLEEFTGELIRWREDSIRDITNKSVKLRGNADASNSSYHFRANLLIEWERLPENESVMNRMIVVPFFSSDKKWTNAMISDLRHNTYLFDFVKKTYKNWNNVEKFYVEWLDVLAKAWLLDRELQLYAFLYVVNKMLELAPVEDFIAAVKENIAIITSFEKPDSLDELLSEIIFMERIQPVMYEAFPDTGVWYLSVPLPFHIVSKNRIKIAECVKKFDWAVRIENSCLILEKNKIDSITRKIEKFSHRAIHRDSSHW